MKNFNNDDIQKYEKMTKNAISKIPKLGSFTKTVQKIRYTHILWVLTLSGLGYMGYRMYDYKRYQNQHYIDLFAWKQSLGEKISREDLWQKVRRFDLYSNKQEATTIYEKRLRQETDKFVLKIRSKRAQNEIYEEEPIKSSSKRKKSQQKQQKRHSKQLILSKDYKSKLDLGYVFKLHSKQYVNSITNTGDYLKKTYIIPVKLFNVPFFARKKQEAKKIGKKGKYSKIIDHKGKFDLNSECEKINYWNILVLREAKQEIAQKDEGKITENSSNAQKTKQNSEITSSINTQPMEPKFRVKDKSIQRKQLLFECRKRIKIVEQEIKQRLKAAIDENWQNKGEDNKNLGEDTSFTFTRWEQQQQKSS